MSLAGPTKDKREVPTSSASRLTPTSSAVSSPLARTRSIWSILSELVWFNFLIVTITPLLAIYGMVTTPLHRATVVFSGMYYFFNMIGITAGYHRLWSHRSYKASAPLQYFLALAGAGAVQGSVHWWARGHRSHHRYTDSDGDPYGTQYGLLWTHIGWLLFKRSTKFAFVDISDLRNNPVVLWQHRHYFPLAILFGFIIPSVLPGIIWGDWRGGFFFSGMARLTFVHHSTFCVNSLAHWLGESTYDDKLTPRDHLFTALLTLGEGYHNFHHQFPMDYRNAIKWYQYDPTKWFIALCSLLRLASNLRVFPDAEIRKGQLTMELKKLKAKQDSLPWPIPLEDLPVITWESYQEQAAIRPLVLVSGFIHDVGPFLDDHPGGMDILAQRIGKDATAAFFGGVYDHSNAAHNLLATMRVGVLLGGLEVVSEHTYPPSQKLHIVERTSPSS